MADFCWLQSIVNLTLTTHGDKADIKPDFQEVI